MSSADAWQGIVLKKSRGLLDGSNLYRRLKIRLLDGSTIKVRVGRELWSSIVEGDIVSKTSGHEPVKQ
jgi:hypothetical protein